MNWLQRGQLVFDRVRVKDVGVCLSLIYTRPDCRPC